MGWPRVDQIFTNWKNNVNIPFWVTWDSYVEFWVHKWSKSQSCKSYSSNFVFWQLCNFVSKLNKLIVFRYGVHIGDGNMCKMLIYFYHMPRRSVGVLIVWISSFEGASFSILPHNHRTWSLIAIWMDWSNSVCFMVS